MATIIPFKNGCQFNPHTEHNPSCDILEGHIDEDTFITYGIYVKDYREADGTIIKKGTEFCEYYRGRNYNVKSTMNSYSRMWYAGKIPVKYKQQWELLRSIYPELPTLEKYKEL